MGKRTPKCTNPTRGVRFRSCSIFSVSETRQKISERSITGYNSRHTGYWAEKQHRHSRADNRKGSSRLSSPSVANVDHLFIRLVRCAKPGLATPLAEVRLLIFPSRKSVSYVRRKRQQQQRHVEDGIQLCIFVWSTWCADVYIYV